MNKKVLAATKRAYGDSQQFPDTIAGQLASTKAYKARNLNFRASAPVSVEDAVLIMQESLCLASPVEEGYNNFSPILLAKLPVVSEITLAREGSVCVYVKLPKGQTIDARTQRAMMVDEFHPQSDGTVRLWWD